jgi:hypothetical protein
VDWNKRVENWASEKEDGDRKHDKRIWALAKAEECQEQWQLKYEAAYEQEKKELINKVIQTVMDRIANKQPIDAQSLTEAMHEQICQPSPTSSTFDAALRTVLPPSQNDTDLGSSAGNGRQGNGPPRQRVGLPPMDPSDSSSSDEDLGPRRRTPINPLRRRRDKGYEKEKEEEDKAEQFFKSLYEWLTQPTAAEIARKPKMPEMKAPQIFTGKDKNLFRAWWMSVQDYVETYSSAFPDEDAQVE